MMILMFSFGTILLVLTGIHNLISIIQAQAFWIFFPNTLTLQTELNPGCKKYYKELALKALLSMAHN